MPVKNAADSIDFGTAPLTPRPPSPPDNAKGALWALLAVVTATLMTVAIRLASVEVNSRMIVFLRSAGGLLLCLGALILIRRLRSEVRFSVPLLHIWRGSLMGVSTQLGFYTIAHIPLTTSTVLFATAPIFAAALLIALRREVFSWDRSVAILIGFAGILIVMRPDSSGVSYVMLAGIGSAMLFGLALISSRGLANKDGAFSAFVSSSFMTMLISLPLVAPIWALPESNFIWAVIIVVAVASMARNIADIQAYRLADASILAPISYLRFITLTAAGYFLFSETPDAWTIIGGGVIILAVLYVARLERRNRRPAQNR